MDKAQKTKVQTAARRTNVLESLKDIGSGVTSSLNTDLLGGISKDLLEQILNRKGPGKKTSGDIRVGESLEFSDLLSGKHEENLKLRNQIAFERRLITEEKEVSEKKTNELKVQLQALMQEVSYLAKTTQSLGEEVEVATMQAPSQPGIYHIIFFEKIIDFIRNFRKNIDSASVWLGASNKRAEKKNYWAM
ncbi:hypothetical protein COY29_00740, partial [Candidatus Woesebacteria bacterium CG_4_10_14_0_2_um_filter_39_14]